MHHGNLKAYLISCFAVLFLTVSAFGFILVQNFHYVDERVVLLNKTVQTVADIQELRGEIKTAEANLKDALVRGTDQYLSDYYQAWEVYPKLIDSLEKDLEPDEARVSILENLREDIDSRFVRFDEVLRLYEQYGKAGLDSIHGQKVGLSLNVKIDSTLKALIEDETTRLKQRELSFHESQRLRTDFMVTLALFIIILGGFTGFTISLVIKRNQHELYLRKYSTELESKVKDRTQELENANKEMESFSYSVSHDLRAPLRAIEGYSNILIEDHEKELGEDSLSKIKVIIRNVRQMGQLIDDILNFSRLGRKDLVKTNSDLTKIANSALDDLVRAKESKEGTKIEINDLGFANVDSSILRQVFLNLIGNAIKFSSKKETPTVVVGALATDPATYFVKDNGVGFDMRHVNKLFNVFNRLHSADEFEGTGVGLAIVKKIITKHGGRVWVESLPDCGATFYFSLA